MPTIVVPQGFSFVLVASASTVFLNMWQHIRVNNARQAAKIDYPQMYAEKNEAASSKEAYIFNCVQRAHQNTLESLPHYLLNLFVTGLKRPYLSASLGALWLAGRIFYTIGYSSGDPKKRLTRGGYLSSAALIGLILTSTYTVYEFVVEDL
ncbi:membrane-associated s in eicosanoid and glutathione metabolism [Pyrrhoderma noxium]|uniref:Glutathione S-transferase 3, mitochondrial n=1 Tax=Pyrrhoderma noxium TaxID=2282107 RepID=A0A286UK36_9AGAM|nr:membrane-associated s in eicosanoid and glutathione metabolism [Pyrrhoderma noxium]